MSYTYTTWVNAITNMAATTATDPDFTAIIPSIIDYAEQRIYREANLLTQVTRVTSTSGGGTVTFTPNSRTFNLPVHFTVLDGITPFTLAGVRGIPLIPTTREFIDYAWPTETAPTTPSVPIYFAMITDQQVIIGPAPDTNYPAETIGKVRPTPLSAVNPTTFISLYLPDLFLAASMVFISGYQKNFSAAGDDPQMPINWEQQYGKLLISAATEEAAKRFFGMQWTMTPTGSMTPAPQQPGAGQ